MNDKLEKYYSYLKGIKGVDVAPTVEEFRYAMQDPNKREQYYNYLKGIGNVDVAPTYDSFTKSLVPDALTESIQGTPKKKEATESLSVSDGGDSSLGLQSISSKTPNPFEILYKEPGDLEKIKEQYNKAWEDTPEEFKQFYDTTTESKAPPQRRMFIPVPAIEVLYESMKKRPSAFPVVRDYTAELFKDGLTAYNRGRASGLVSTNLKQENPDFQRIAELQNVIDKNSASGDYKEFIESEGMEFWGAFAKNPPLMLTNLITESIAAQAGAVGGTDPRVVAAGAAAGSAIPFVGTASGAMAGFYFDNSLSLETSSFILEKIQEQGYDVKNANDLERAFSDESLMQGIRQDALKKGLPVAILDAVSAGVAGKLVGKTLLSKALKETGTQSVLGGAGEALGQVVSEGKISSPVSIFAEMVSEPVTSIPEITVGVLQSKPSLLIKPSKQTIDGRKVLDDAQASVEEDMVNASEWLKPELAKKAQEIVKAKNELVNKDADFYSGFSEEDKNKVSGINERLSEIQDLLKSDQLSEGTRKAYEEEANKIIEEKFTIEQKYIDKPVSETEQTTQVTKTEEDAVQERKTEEVPVGEEAEVGEEVVGKVREQTEEVQGQEEVRQFAERIARGEDVTSLEDQQFYENNKEEVESALQQIQREEEVTAPTKEVDKVAKVAGVKAKNIRGLYDINRKMFGQNRVKSLASAVVMDRAIGQMAKRSGVSKAEMYGKIQFKKGEKAPSGALKQEALIFKSTAQEGIGKIQQKAATPEQWVKMINDKGGKGTSQELEWTGLADFLSDYVKENNVKSVPKEVVEQYIADNQIEIVEVTKGDSRILTKSEMEDIGFTFEKDGDLHIIKLPKGGDYDFESVSNVNLEEAIKAANNAYDEFIDENGGGYGVSSNTKYPEYTLEGGENYREVLLTLPQEKSASEYKSSHWNETNIVAHLRINERTLPNGERVMFIEEVQSDWAQEGKKKGFKDNLSEVQKKYDELYQKSKKLESEALKYKRENISPNTSIAQAMEMDNEFKKKYEAYREAERQRLEILPSVRKNEGKVPDMPYKKTDQWVGMAMRRALKMAADEGFDRVAWVTGEQSAERYDLSKQVDRVVATKKPNEDEYRITIFEKFGNETPSQLNLKAEELEANLGKDLAEKIINETTPKQGLEAVLKDDSQYQKLVKERESKRQEQLKTRYSEKAQGSVAEQLQRGKDLSRIQRELNQIENKIESYLNRNYKDYREKSNEYSGLDLKVGGEGMKAFYNSILPKVAKKEAQRFDKKAKVDVVDFTENSRLRDLENRLETVRSNEEFDTIVEEINRIRGISKEQSKTIGKQLSIAITPEMRMNLNSAVPLFQGEQGAMLAEDGRFIIYALTDPNVSTPLHELAHVYEHYLTETERNSVLKWAGATEWTTEVSEKFARGFERYLAEGKAPTVSLQKIFDKFKEWLTDIYNGITGSDIDLKLNKPMTDLYNQMLGEAKGKKEATPTTKEVKSKKEIKARTEELKSKIKDRLKGKKLGFAYDPKQQAKEDLDFFKDVVELASIYIQQGVKNAEQFAKKAGIEFNRLSREAFKAAKKGDIGYDEQNIWEVMSAIIPKKEKKAVEANRKAVQRKYKKGDYTNIQDEVAAFIDLPLHRISDQALLNQVNETLANAKKGKVNPKELTELTQQVKENLNQQELSIDPNDFTPERLNERLGKLPERIGKIKDDDFDKNTLKDSRSRFSRLINDLRFLENVNNILFELKQLTQDQFQENQKAIADARAKLNEKAKNADANIQEALKELNKENENKAKVYRPQDVTDDPILENEVRNFFEAIEDYDADDISLALEVADIFDDLEVGYIPVGKMAEIANTITATVAANSEGMQKAKDNIASMPKEKSGFIARAFEMFNPVRKASVDFQEWVKRFRNQEFWSWENILGVNKESPIYKLLNDVVTQGEAYSESVATEMAALYKALKFPVLRKGIAGKERLEGAYKQFMKNLSSQENREKRVMVGMIMIERRFRELYDKPFWNNVMSDKDKTNRLSGKKDKLLGGVSEREIYEKAYAKLPKNEDGTIDLEAAFKQVRKDRISNSLINFLEEKFDENGELAQKQKVANQKRGLPTEFGRFYFPFLRKGGISQETKEFDFNDFFSAVNPKIASDRGKEIKDSSYSMMEADPLNVFSDYIHQVNRDYHLTDAIRTAYKFFNQAIKNSDGEAKTVFSAMKDALKYNVAWAFQAPDSTITDKLLQASYAYYLTTMYRAVAEPTSEMIRSIGAGEINTKMLKYAYDEGMSSIKDMFAKVKGLRLNENGEIETTGEFRSNFKKLLDFTNSPFRRQFSRQFADGSIRTSAKRDAGLFEKTSNMIMGFPNRASLFVLWMPAFDNRYKEITGKDFDYTKIDDENYLKENRKDIRDAAAYADKNTARYKGYATALGGRTMNKAFVLPFIPGWWNNNIDALKDPGLFKMNQFLGSFGWRDSFNIAEGVRDIALSLGDNMTSEDLKKYRTDNPTTALRIITALVASGISYPIIRRMMAYLDSKDEDEEDLPQWKKDMVKDVEENGFFTIDGMIQESLGYATFLATSRYGYSSRFGTLTLLGIIQNQLLNQKKFATEEEKKKIDAAIDRINETSKAFLFSEPINLTGSGQWGAATPAKDVIEMIPGYGLPMQFGIQLERSINTVIKAEERGTDEQQKAAYILAANDLIKTALLFGGGTVLPAGKEIDRIATGKKIKLSEELTEKKGGSLNLENLKPSLPEMPSIF